MNNERETTEESVILDQATGGVPAGESVIAIPDAAERMGVVVTKVMDLLNNGQLLAIRLDNVRYIPEMFFTEDGDLNKFVPGVISLLSDGGYSSQEILEYLYEADDSLPGRPVDALHGHLAREVMRRAQAMAIV
ncbi:Rv2175c family DNA-binding protein [Corynebacterium suicordis]|nr:Rv2175c family DNA-binding protein [Corynebacterium suicordis]MDR6277201.1 hypothetical protein [Corynebacterium suicordis]